MKKLVMLAVAAIAAIGAARAEVPSADLAPLVRTLMPQVVNISFVRHKTAMTNLKTMQADRAAAVPTGKGVGTGFIVDAAGIICTNRHVTDGGDEIYVSLSDNTRLRAELLYRSPDIDLALIRVKPPRPLTPVTFGDSDEMMPGNQVIAIGNPLGLGGTVTTGIVSARDRDIKDTPVDSFMQIDAAINPGNSGGPLFNLKGEVIGMNTALITLPGATTSGSIGLNFAIPGNDVRFILDSLRKYRAVRLGVLGAEVQDVSPGLADALALPRVEGAIVATVAPGSPAEKAGLRPGDVITGVAQAQVKAARTLTRYVTASPGEADVPLRILRGGVPQTLTVTLGEKSAGPQTVNMLMGPPPEMAITKEDLGLDLAELTPALRQKYKLAAGAKGLVITRVAKDRLGAYLGFTEGAVLRQIQDVPVRKLEDIVETSREAEKQGRQQVAVLVADTDGVRWISVPLHVR
jgi:serine protease Do